MKCQIDYSINGIKTHTVVYAPTSVDALLKVLEMLPPAVAVKAIVRAVKPLEVVQ